MQNAKCRMQNAKCRMQNAECRMQNAECRMQNAECRMQKSVSLSFRTRSEESGWRCGAGIDVHAPPTHPDSSLRVRNDLSAFSSLCILHSAFCISVSVADGVQVS